MHYAAQNTGARTAVIARDRSWSSVWESSPAPRTLTQGVLADPSGRWQHARHAAPSAGPPEAPVRPCFRSAHEDRCLIRPCMSSEAALEALTMLLERPVADKQPRGARHRWHGSQKAGRRIKQRLPAPPPAARYNRQLHECTSRLSLSRPIPSRTGRLRSPDRGSCPDARWSDTQASATFSFENTKKEIPRGCHRPMASTHSDSDRWGATESGS